MSSDSSLDDAKPASVFFDGLTNRKRLVSVRLGEALEIAEDGALIAAWPLDTVRRVAGKSGVLTLRSRVASELARCEIADISAQNEVLAACRNLGDDEWSGRGALFRIVGWSVLAAVSIAGIAWFGLPAVADRLAPMVPPALERRIGDAAGNQARAIFGKKICDAPEGVAALKTLVAKLQDGLALPFEIRPVVLPTKIKNAFVIPGGAVFILRGLIESAKSPDELGAVLAHEFGHIAHRDAMRAVIKQGGAGFLLGLLFGDVLGAGALIAAANATINAAYSRDAETQADDFAVAVMHAHGRSAKPLGEFLLRMSDGEKLMPFSFLLDHPLSADRFARIGRGDVPATGDPLLSEADWSALKAVCTAQGDAD